MGKKQEIDLAAMLEQEYASWEHYRECGGRDPFYEDGYNMQLIRNHISYYKKQIEEKYNNDTSKYPAIYFREMPPEVCNKYMTKAGEIRDIARERLEIYLSVMRTLLRDVQRK